MSKARELLRAIVDAFNTWDDEPYTHGQIATPIEEAEEWLEANPDGGDEALFSLITTYGAEMLAVGVVDPAGKKAAVERAGRLLRRIRKTMGLPVRTLNL